MFKVAIDVTKIKREREVAQGRELVVDPSGVVLLSCLIKPNAPPCESTEERFSSWEPTLEIHPRGLEQVDISVITNDNRKNWPAWSDYYKSEKRYLSVIAQANRESGFTREFGEIKEEKQKCAFIANLIIGSKKCLRRTG